MADITLSSLIGGGSGSLTLTGDVTGTGTGSVATTIGANKVTLANMAQIATDSFLGRDTAGTGNVEVLSVATVKTLLNLTGTNTGDQTITLTGNVTGSGTGSFATTIAAGAVTLANMANVATGTVFYRKTASSGAPEVQTLATLKTDLGLTGNNTGDQTITLTGHVTGSGTGSFATTIANGVVTNAMQANMAANSISGNNTGSPAAPMDLTVAQVKTLLAYTKSDVGLSAVENTALSTWAGSANITTLGTIATGTWNGTTIAVNRGGTGVTTSTGTGSVVLSASPTIANPTFTGNVAMAGNLTNSSAAYLMWRTSTDSQLLVTDNSGATKINAVNAANSAYKAMQFEALSYNFLGGTATFTGVSITNISASNITAASNITSDRTIIIGGSPLSLDPALLVIDVGYLYSQDAGLQLKHAGTKYWQIGNFGGGSTFEIQSYNTSGGALIGTALSIDNATRVVDVYGLKIGGLAVEVTGTSFTPIALGGTTAGTGTYTSQVGIYTRVGNRVDFFMSVAWTAHTGTGVLRLGGLPFNATASVNCPVTIGLFANLTLAANTAIVADVLGGSNQVRVLAYSTAGGSVGSAGIALDTAMSIQVSGTYFI